MIAGTPIADTSIADGSLASTTGLATVLDVAGVEKAFAGVQALSGVSLRVAAGEIHALLGENGAGKSTLIKVLAGVVAPDAGTIAVAGQPLVPGFGPADVARAGIRFVHQDLGLVDTLSVAENVAFVTGFAKTFGLIDRRATAAAVTHKLRALGSTVSPDALVGDLPQAEKVIVALARAMQGDPTVIVLDEVTASLPEPDVVRLHASIDAARRRGTAFVYVSHRLQEVFRLCDRLSVLRDGRNVACDRTGAVDLDTVVRWIAGRDIPRRAARTAPASAATPPRLVVRGLRAPALPGPVDLAVRAHEILGVTGIRGSGYDILCRALAGLDPEAEGRIAIDGADVTLGSPQAARAAGIDLVLGDRSQAVFGDLSVRENLFPMAIGNGLARRPSREKRAAADRLDRFGVRPAGASETAMIALSGGNQQKVLFARALDRRPKVIVLIDPTAGVDIGSRAALHGLLERAAADGAAVVIASSDLEEIVALAHRAVVIADGCVATEIAGDDLDLDGLFTDVHRSHGGAGDHASARAGAAA